MKPLVLNPRKLYLADHALAAAFSPAEELDRGHLLENIVVCELARTSREISCCKTREGFEVDFLAASSDGSERLIQVCADLPDATTRNRELRALECAHQEHPAASPLLLCGEEPPCSPDQHIAEMSRNMAGI